MSSILVVLGLAASLNLEVEQLEVKTTFLHGDLEEEIYMEQPEGFKVKGKENLVCKLKKSLYGLKLAARQWYKKFDSFMVNHDYKRTTSDHCVFVKRFLDSDFIILLLYVDAMLMSFAMKDLGLQSKYLHEDYSVNEELQDLDFTEEVILATNIVETSVTIPGIKYVIDPGLLKAPTYCARTGMESLIFVPTSKFAKEVGILGRAGREGPGKCFRLYPEIEFEKLRDSTIPEITRCNLSNVILQLKALGVDDIFGFDFMEKPSRDAVIKSLEILVLLDAITEEYKLSDPVGHQMAWLPLKPIHSKALILASQFNCLEEMLITVAMLSVESIFYAPREKLEEAQTATKCFSSLEGDHLILINIYRAFDEFLEKSKIGINKEKAEKSLRKWCKENFINNRFLRHAREIHRQIQRNVEQMGLHITSCEEEMLQYRRCLAAACFINAALKQPDGTYRYQVHYYEF
ncbi:pre-mRNA-splicing factor ATP-dependent RNA helicase DEAH10-like [Camellia sinensis]|uniref:pre-mRNA-splicing factor ATP-dependent RNA helicase DEAH10-like n=1 Tax=Camellia sinensis TaxID=4442 RepID=UPI00103574F3|nr:pre-mRNA-splicing factor ATP-dependent RNA helicase DEAH10-like [Camellia sinensis]